MSLLQQADKRKEVSWTEDLNWQNEIYRGRKKWTTCVRTWFRVT